MTAVRIDGVATAATVRGELVDRIAALKPSLDVAALRARVLKLTDGHPLYPGLVSPGTWS